MHHNVTVNTSLYTKHPPRPIVLDWDDDALPGEVLEIDTIDLIMYVLSTHVIVTV